MAGGGLFSAGSLSSSLSTSVGSGSGGVIVSGGGGVIMASALTGYNYWIYNASPSPGRLQVNTNAIVYPAKGGSPSGGVSVVYGLYHNNNPNYYNYSPDKMYQITTNTVELYATAASFSVTPGGWTDRLYYSKSGVASLSSTKGMTANGNPGSGNTQSYLHYSTPPTNIITDADVTFYANGTFSNAGTNNNRGIVDFKVYELDFKIQGFSYYKIQNYELSYADPKNSLGWYYNISSDTYNWYDRISGTPSDLNLGGYNPVGGNNNNKKSDKGYRLNNAIYKFIPYSYFNINFGYKNITSSPVSVYLSPSPPSTATPSNSNYLAGIYTPPAGSVLIATITQSTVGTYSSTEYSINQSFYGLRGNQYLLFVGPFMGATANGSTYSSVYLNNITIDGAYHPGNNRQYEMTTGSTYSTTVIGLTGATYATIVGNGNTVNATFSLAVSRIYSKIGNGTFKAGIWENGVWNSGWRVDDGMYEFHNVYQFFSYNRHKRWRLQISGPTASASNFNIGDNVSIGNIVAVDINEDRKLLKGYYTIINKTNNSIIVEFDNNFPIRRIERDSDNHRIYVTKNVWLSGAFLNGYFKGVWNYGLFKGYPLITEMFDSHWIDGIFDGGHIGSSLYTVPGFVSTSYKSGKLGLTFTQSHGLVAGDLITINKSDKTINAQYDGDYNVSEVVDNYQIIVDVEYGYDSVSESGSITIDKSKGLLQRVDFKSNNVSKITSAYTFDPGSVFVYNSWMDVNYNTSYASNIGKPQSLLNSLSRKSYSENNLYGYITNDVLESSSTFRDSFSTTIRKYRLGTKYKIFADFIGDAGNFENEFGGTQSDAESTFIRDGWTFSRPIGSSLTFSRTDSTENDNSLTGEELRVEVVASGGILDITPFSDEFIANRTYEEVQKLRYTKVEFDLITVSGYIATYPYNSNYSYLSIYGKQFTVPPIHFNNLNLSVRNIVLPSSNTYTKLKIRTIQEATYLPIYKNINHLNTKNKKKAEYFYNKRNLAMHFYGLQPGYSTNDYGITSEYVIDNLHFYEVDMIPFFQYFTENNINKSVQIPFQGISPFIDYTNASFNFIDNLSIGLDSIRTQNSNTVVSGIGVGIGAVVSTSDSGSIYGNLESSNQSFDGNTAFVSSPFVLSDIRLKTNINKAGVSNSGINIYEFKFINQPNDLYQGIIAQELIGTEFESAIRIESDGYYHVDYSKLDVEFKKIS
jgi:hypothetical protein